MVKTAAISLSLLLSFGACLARAAEVERELGGIKQKIEKERQGIAKVKRQEGSVLESLAKIDESLDRKTKDLKKVNATLETILANLQKKEEEAKRLLASLGDRRELLKQRARALYKWQRGGSPFILLNGAGSVAGLMQGKRYLEVTLAYDRKLVDQLSDESQRQLAIKKELEQRRAEVDRQRRSLIEIKESIRVEREKKKEVLAGLRREKESRQRALKELEQAALKLQKMIDEMNRKSAASSKDVPAGTGFETMRGRVGTFGKTRHQEFAAELFRKGIDIEASLGDDVKAVEGGKVVFADRFSGYGKMMIIDHGQRYYTLYAHLSELLKKPGEPVRRGEPIAQVGDSDSLAGARLYFEIRKDGKPLDPIPWFRK
jgi:septal ring factor EnvC (AmiA/AmiB activator)